MDDRTDVLLSFGEHELDSFNFDAAYDAFKKAADTSGDPRAYFGMALAKFKIRYIKDESVSPVKRAASCHQISQKVFSECDEFKKAFSLAASSQQIAFRGQASEIDLIREAFMNLKAGDMGYDVFISAKTRRADGGETEAAKEARKLFDHFVQLGMRPYFSKQDNDFKEGGSNEALTFYALTSAPCMIVVCFDENDLDDACVKSEYVRFGEMIACGKKDADSLTVLSKGFVVDDLPYYAGKVCNVDLDAADAYDKLDEFADAHAAHAENESAAIAAMRRKTKLKKAENEAQMLLIEQEKLRIKLDKENAKQRERVQKAEERRLRAEQRKTDAKTRKLAAKTRARARKTRLKNSASDFFDKLKDNAPDFFAAVGHALAMPFIGIARWFRSDNDGLVVTTHMLSLLLELAGLIFMVAFPFAQTIVKPSPEYSAYIAVGAALAAVMLFHFVYTCVNTYEVAEYLMSVAVSIGIAGALSVICFCIGWFTNNMHDWIWVFFAFGLAGVVFGFICVIVSTDTDSPVIIFGTLSAVLFGFAALCILGGWLYVQQNINDGFENGYYYTFTDTGMVDIRIYEYDSEELDIPCQVAGYEVNSFLGAAKGGGNVLKKVVMDDDILAIGKAAFKDCTALREVEFSQSLTYIGEKAFKNCGSLKAVLLKDNVTLIDEYAFEDCTALAELKLSASLETIEFNAFANCSSLVELTVPDSLTMIGSGAFTGCDKLTVFHFPEGSVWKRQPFIKLYDAFNWDSDQGTIRHEVVERGDALLRG